VLDPGNYSVLERKFVIGKLGSSYCKECKRALKRGTLIIADSNKPQPQPQMVVAQPVVETVTVQQTQIQGQPVLNPYPVQFNVAGNYPVQYQHVYPNAGVSNPYYPYQQ
jgi:hypothetical protein